MAAAEISLKKEDITKINKEITVDEAKKIIDQLGAQFSINLMEIARKIASKEADGFSLNKNSPYTHLYIGNGSKNISIELITLEKEIKIKIPCSFLLE